MRMLRVLFYLEDPGAANYVYSLPADLNCRGCTSLIVADGFAAAFLKSAGIVSHPSTLWSCADKLLEECKPSIVIVGTSENLDSFAHKLVVSSRGLGVPTVGIVDMAGNAEYRFRGKTEDSLAHAPDWLFVPDKFTCEKFHACGYPEGRIEVCGHPQYDTVRQERTKLEQLGLLNVRMNVFPEADGRTVVMFVAEINGGLQSPEQYQKSPKYTLAGFGSETRTGVVIEEFLNALDQHPRSRVYRVLRLHPKNSPTEFNEYYNNFDFICSGGKPSPFVYGSDLVVGMTSNLLVEAALLDLPTLSIVPKKFESSNLVTVRAGLTQVVWRREDLQQKLFMLPTISDRTFIRDACNIAFPPGAREKNINSLLRIIEKIV